VTGAAAGPPPPAIVLVRPQLGENIGKAARAMLNFGLAEMRLVSPRDGWPNPDAGPAASGADIVLENARVYESVADAVADCAFVYATTVRKRGLTKEIVGPEKAAQDTRGRAGRTAILFGPERSGLETDDVALAQAILTVPVNPQFASLNLAQAVILFAYEWSKAGVGEAATFDNYEGPAPQADLEGLIAQLTTALDAVDYFRVEVRAATARRTLRNMLTRPSYSAKEVRTLRGVITALTKERN
jgi:tRNA/rRNA methyltransferase